VDNINSIIIQDFLNKVSIATRTRQKSLNISIDEANEISLQIGCLMALALEKSQSKPQQTENSTISVVADGGSF
jgi:hypothetical protein